MATTQQDEVLSEYEKQRLRNIDRNNKIMGGLGLDIHPLSGRKRNADRRATATAIAAARHKREPPLAQHRPAAAVGDPAVGPPVLKVDGARDLAHL